MFSRTVEYALRAAVFLAADPQLARTTDQIAQGTQVPRGYLSKVLQQLGRAGLVHSQRGLHGGFMIARQPEDVSALEVIEAVEPIQRIRECPLGLGAHGKNLCSLHRKLDEAMASIETAFGATTLAELLSDSGNKSRPLCNMTVEDAPI